jgi:hypothetical protein
MVRSDTPVVVTWGKDSFGYTDFQTMDPATYTVDVVRGIMYIQGPLPQSPLYVNNNNTAYSTVNPYADQFVRVQYRSGAVGAVIDPATDPQTVVTPAEAIPPWMYEAILSQVPVTLNSQQTTNRNTEAQGNVKLLSEYSKSMISPFNRSKGLAFRPITYNVVS